MESSAALSGVGHRDRAALFCVPVVCCAKGQAERVVAAIFVAKVLGGSVIPTLTEDVRVGFPRRGRQTWKVGSHLLFRRRSASE